MTEFRASYEKSDANAKGIAWFAVAMVVAAVIMHVGLWMFERGLNWIYPEVGPASRIGKLRIEPPPPRLQSSPAVDLQELQAAENAVLRSYGWVNRDAGVIRIPIERAMDLTSQRGLPARQQTGKGTP